MANTVYGPYTAHTWNSGDSATATRLNNIETQSSLAFHGFNPDFVGAGFFLSGCLASGTNGTTTVNIASGVAYILMTDGTLGRITVGSATQTTSTPSTTYHLYLQPDGTFYWSTSNSPQTNSLAIANVATNGSGQISSITDQRTVNFTSWSSAAGKLTLPTLTGLVCGHYGYDGGAGAGDLIDTGGSSSAHTGTGSMFFKGGDSGTGFWFQVPNGTNVAHIDQTGKFALVAAQATAGTFGVPVLAAITKRQNVTNTTNTTIVTWTNSTGAHCLARFWMLFYVGSGNTNAGTISMTYTFTDPDAGALTGTFLESNTGTSLISSLSLTKGVLYRTLVTSTLVSSGQSLSLLYQNSAAGTISDMVTGFIEPLG